MHDFILTLHNIHGEMLHWLSIFFPSCHLWFHTMCLMRAVWLLQTAMNQTSFRVLYFGYFIPVDLSLWSRFFGHELCFTVCFSFYFNRISRLSSSPPKNGCNNSCFYQQQKRWCSLDPMLLTSVWFVFDISFFLCLSMICNEFVTFVLFDMLEKLTVWTLFSLFYLHIFK